MSENFFSFLNFNSIRSTYRVDIFLAVKFEKDNKKEDYGRRLRKFYNRSNTEEYIKKII